MAGGRGSGRTGNGASPLAAGDRRRSRAKCGFGAEGASGGGGLGEARSGIRSSSGTSFFLFWLITFGFRVEGLTLEASALPNGPRRPGPKTPAGSSPAHDNDV